MWIKVNGAVGVKRRTCMKFPRQPPQDSETSVTCKASFSTGGSSSSEEAENLLRRRICGPTVSSLDTIELDELRDKTGLLEREQDTGQGAKSNMPVISSAKAAVARTVATGLEELEGARSNVSVISSAKAAVARTVATGFEELQPAELTLCHGMSASQSQVLQKKPLIRFSYKVVALPFQNLDLCSFFFIIQNSGIRARLIGVYEPLRSKEYWHVVESGVADPAAGVILSET
ncbi:hypothetical protein RJ641_012190 [Dillenia turbinata]|uniref:Uncharacterized protein n=1 Tax=Dillenia turbinata TaxID=194707 RepID=A0AAN8UR68_9MAGN